ncbi:hypothetical protein NQZ79_g4251 [Umbelopsis isabellina]|nr:hypothetical protein NQZ79_g4251 [Umbelopsis isabellina]
MWTAVSLLVVGSTTTLAELDIGIPISVSKYIFLGAILISFLLLFWDIRKGRIIVASRDISYTVTSVFASRYYSLKDYSYYCFFCKIQKSKRTTDEIAFFVFFTLKGWKRLLLAEAPRQVINAVTLYALIRTWLKHTVTIDSIWESMGHTVVAKMMTGTMAFSFAIFIVSFFMICIAAIMYIPLLCHIQGNLKEYCCHKVDKRKSRNRVTRLAKNFKLHGIAFLNRVAELLKKQAKKRQAKNGQAKNGQGRNGKGIKENIPLNNMVKPTLPSVNLYEEEKRFNGNPYPGHVGTPISGYNEPQYNNYMVPPVGRRGSTDSYGSDMAGYRKDQYGWSHSPQPSYPSPVPPYHNTSPRMDNYQQHEMYGEADHAALLQHAADPYIRRPSGESAHDSEAYYNGRQQDYYNSPYRNSPRPTPANTPGRYPDQQQYHQQQQQQHHSYRGY